MSDHDTSPGAVFLTKIFDQTLAAAAASIDTGAIIPAGFSALEILTYVRGDAAATGFNVTLQFNGDTGANYDERWIRNTGNTTNASSSAGATGVDVNYGPAASAAANYFSAGWARIPAYDNTTGYKAGVASFGDPSVSGAQQTWAETFVWKSTSAINRIKMLCNTGNFVAGSRLIIYGLP